MLACTLRVALPLCRLARFATRRPHALRDTCPAPRHHTASSTLTLRRPNMSNILQAAIARDKQKERPAPKPAPQASARASQPVIQKAFRSPPQYGVLRNSRPQYPTSADPFTSTSSSQKLLPSPPPSENRGSRHSSSKSSGEKDKLSQVCNNSSAFQDIDSSTTRTTVASSSIASLHDAVYFDMDDFDDDLTLDFDVDEPLIAPALKAAVASLPPAQPCMPPPPSTPKHLDAPDSSAPLPWSSSPIPYRQQAASRLPAKIYSQDSITLEKRAKQQAVAPAAVVQPQPREEPPSRLTKPSRRIPWLAKQEEDFCEVVMEKTKTTTSDRSTKVSSERVTREAANKHKTPLKGPSMPWDMSASAVKASRNVIRVQKRSVSTLAGDDLEGPLKKVKPDQPAPMFLSEEQRRVIHMVRDMNKSVFFTGSAGQYPHTASIGVSNP
ncbi:hypothetical protein DFH27DRAFT_6770 [Peziza echinospora]|nr:hypothetical protein DFH27DRAFT_6770 [Peziza echinospora]